MANVNYAKLQASAKSILQQFNAAPVTIRLLNNSVVQTIGVFQNGEGKNTDNRQNPTWVTGFVGAVIILPGIDFYNPTTNTTSTPQVGGTVEWTQNMVLFKKVIVMVDKEEPIPNVPILITLGIE